MRKWAEEKEDNGFSTTKEGVITYKGRLCIPDYKNIRNEILYNAHNTPYSVHPGTVKMYQDLQKHYWWHGMKRDIVKYVERCLTCQQVKAEHQRLGGELQPIEVPDYQATIGMAPYEALYGRKCRYPVHWHESGEHKLMDLDFVSTTTDAIEKIQKRIRVAQSR
ncbi:hypothetical protein UlMin_033198 [Ulmus minor]